MCKWHTSLSQGGKVFFIYEEQFWHLRMIFKNRKSTTCHIMYVIWDNCYNETYFNGTEAMLTLVLVTFEIIWAEIINPFYYLRHITRLELSTPLFISQSCYNCFPYRELLHEFIDGSREKIWTSVLYHNHGAVQFIQ